MSGISIGEIARKIKEAKELAADTGKVQYVFFDGIFLNISNQYNRSYAAKCFPGGRVELKGPIGDRVRKWKKRKPVELIKKIEYPMLLKESIERYMELSGDEEDVLLVIDGRYFELPRPVAKHILACYEEIIKLRDGINQAIKISMNLRD